MTRPTRLLVIAGLTLTAVVAIWTLPPIPQSQAYHVFADQRPLFGIPNFLNVISDAPFVLVGILGLSFLWRQRASHARGVFIERSEQWAYVVFFLGVALTGFGSAYYHLVPDNARLVWDRAPMTLVFMSLFSAVMSERISPKAGLLSLLPLTIVGIGSVVHWHMSELNGQGDLRPYIMVQYFPLVAIPLIMLLFPSRYTGSGNLVAAGALYAAAKGFEVLDAHVFALGRLVSGHTLKHLMAAMATYMILRMLRKRHPLPAKS